VRPMRRQRPLVRPPGVPQLPGLPVGLATSGDLVDKPPWRCHRKLGARSPATGERVTVTPEEAPMGVGWIPNPRRSRRDLSRPSPACVVTRCATHQRGAGSQRAGRPLQRRGSAGRPADQEVGPRSSEVRGRDGPKLRGARAGHDEPSLLRGYPSATGVGDDVVDDEVVGRPVPGRVCQRIAVQVPKRLAGRATHGGAAHPRRRSPMDDLGLSRAALRGQPSMVLGR
jgi:hypothetical protein